VREQAHQTDFGPGTSKGSRWTGRIEAGPPSM